MWFLKLLKKFVNADGVNKAFTLGIIGLLVVLSFYALDYFWQIAPQGVGVKIVRESAKLLLGFSGVYLFFIGAAYTWQNRCEWDWDFGWIFSSLITGICGVLGFWGLASVVLRTLATLYSIMLPDTVLYYVLIPGAFFLALGVLTFVWRIVRKVSQNLWRALKDAWDRA